LAHRERGVEPAIAAGDDHTLVRLYALAVALDDLHLHDDGVTRLEIRNLAGHAALLDFLDDLAHGSHLRLCVRRVHARREIHSATGSPPARGRGAQSDPVASTTFGRPPPRAASAAPRRDSRTAAPAVRAVPRTPPAACNAASRGAPQRRTPRRSSARRRA